MNYGKSKLMTNLSMECKVIKGKRAFIFESHHHALYPWALVKRENCDLKISLFSFDYHTDILDPFCKYAYNNSLNQEQVRGFIRDINYNDDRSVENAINKLHNDEHIKTAIQCGIIDHAFIISHSANADTPLSCEEKNQIDNYFSEENLMQMILGTHTIIPRESMTYPVSDIYMPEYNCSNYRMILDDGFLKGQFETLARMSKDIQTDGVIQSKYVLDIDLDYFTDPSAIKPENRCIFASLVKNAEIITVAKESVCVNMCSNGTTNSQFLLNGILSLVEEIL